jgi:hypothetical protein
MRVEVLRARRPLRTPLGRSVAGRAIARTPIARAADRTGGPPETDAPCALAHLELTESGGPQLRDQRGQQLTGEPVDRGVVGGTTLCVARRLVVG